MTIEETMNNFTFETMVENAVKIPGVKVNRNEFLVKTFEGENVDIHKLIDEGPVAANIPASKLREIADRLIKVRTSTSAVASFIAGIPGGLALAATIPADTLQFFAMTLRLAQEVAYMYGSESFWDGDNLKNTYALEQLVFYVGTMYDITGAAGGARYILSENDYQLSDSEWKDAASAIGTEACKKLTTSTAATGISKILPVIGGIVSGSVTFVQMAPMGGRLADALEEAVFNYTDEKGELDYQAICELGARAKKTASSVDDMFEQTDDDKSAKEAAPEVTGDVYEQLEKLAKLKEMGAITEEEFNAKKAKLLDLI